jgi:hypothetical protein
MFLEGATATAAAAATVKRKSMMIWNAADKKMEC